MKRFSALVLTAVLAAGCFWMTPAVSAQTAGTPAAGNTGSTPAVSVAPAAAKENSTCRKWCGELLFYVPNRIMDTLDIFSINLKFGLNAGFSFNATQAIGIGAQYGPAVMACKEFNRQCGLAVQEGWKAQFLFMKAENVRRTPGLGNVKNFWEFGSNFPTPAEGIYANNIRDYWALSCSASCLAGVDIAIHPLEIVDLFCGIFLLDSFLPQPPFIHDSIPLNPMIF